MYEDIINKELVLRRRRSELLAAVAEIDLEIEKARLESLKTDLIRDHDGD